LAHDVHDAEMNDAELPDEADMDSTDSDEFAETVECPHCRKSLYEQAEVCPHCGKYISTEDSNNRKPLWLILGVVICLAIILLWIR
jgi:uncharacterized paraquat-inducible protein A